MITLKKEFPLKNQHKWRNDPRITHWTRQNGNLSYAQVSSYVSNAELDPTIELFGVFKDEHHVGTAALTSINYIHRTAEFSLLIDPDRHKEGLGAEALKALFVYGFDKMNLNCIWGETFDGNPAVKLFTKIGLKYEGTLRQRYFKDGQYINSHMMSMTKEEYLNQSWKPNSLALYAPLLPAHFSQAT